MGVLSSLPQKHMAIKMENGNKWFVWVVLLVSKTETKILTKLRKTWLYKCFKMQIISRKIKALKLIAFKLPAMPRITIQSRTVWLQYSSHVYKNEVINLLLGIKVKELPLEKGLPSAQIFVWCRSVLNTKFLIYYIQLKNKPTQFGERKSRRIRICSVWSERLEHSC